ncbi:hypothetical protein DFH09DRAFT_1278735, partial [Mycena vulgaris]
MWRDQALFFPTTTSPRRSAPRAISVDAAYWRSSHTTGKEGFLTDERDPGCSVNVGTREYWLGSLRQRKARRATLRGGEKGVSEQANTRSGSGREERLSGRTETNHIGAGGAYSGDGEGIEQETRDCGVAVMRHSVGARSITAGEQDEERDTEFTYALETAHESEAPSAPTLGAKTLEEGASWEEKKAQGAQRGPAGRGVGKEARRRVGPSGGRQERAIQAMVGGYHVWSRAGGEATRRWDAYKKFVMRVGPAPESSGDQRGRDAIRIPQHRSAGSGCGKSLLS